MALPSPPQGIERCGYQILSEDGALIHLTIYRPEAIEQVLPCLVYFHGGGFCLRDAGYIYRYAAQYAQSAQCAVAFVHYRTSDIAPLPVPFQDCYAALCWVWDSASELRVDRARVAVDGDSAGDTLAAACALRARDKDGPYLCFQFLIYLVTDCQCRIDFVVFRQTGDVEKWRVNVHSR